MRTESRRDVYELRDYCELLSLIVGLQLDEEAITNSFGDLSGLFAQDRLELPINLKRRSVGHFLRLSRGPPSTFYMVTSPRGEKHLSVTEGPQPSSS
ncbi:hypothetical protein PoB_001497300 [Plakobranchus ocellatus]|uniref:Uncharacterized protein n=1 Tax=Plakobranchus ocellatus TaxID=259542 RepID=A0AAV3Z1I1_9GAST|nr:hypothetical protein PoB_001497300 [Plakobranchus ocellatus]